MLSDELRITTKSDVETELLGFTLGAAAYPGLTILLRGDLGMGKTTLTQGIGRALGIKRIKSPSFIIVSEHDGRLPLAHADLYRLEETEQVEELDFEAYIDDGFLLIVEWAERWTSPPSSDRLEILFDQGIENPMERSICLKAEGCRAESMLKHIAEKLGGVI